MTIWASLYDAGTTMGIDPLVDIPGMDQGFYRELDMEYQFLNERQNAINDLIRTTDTFNTLRPWPAPFPWRMWVDYTERHTGVLGGYKANLYHWDDMLQDFEPVASDLTQIEEEDDYEPNVDRRYARITRNLNGEEISATTLYQGTPTPHLRLVLHNEVGGKYGGNFELSDPSIIHHEAHVGYEYKLDLSYNALYAPCDMRHPEWYDIVSPDGRVLDQTGKAHVFSLLNNGAYRLYLRPANWRWVATVRAVYVYLSWFEAFYTEQLFTHAWFNRPPVYPHRHDLLHTTTTLPFEWNGVYYSLDGGIDYGFNSSRGAGFLRYSILDAQWWTLSEAYIFNNNDPATLVLWLWPPEKDDIVLGISEIDRVTGADQIYWVKQNRDLTDEYPRTVIGNYIVLDFVAAD